MTTKFGRFQSSEFFQGIDHHPDVEIIKNPPEWKYVEDLISKKLIPQPENESEYSSGLQPQDPQRYKDLSYYVKRTRNHMLPVYLPITHRASRRITFIKNIEGDIWKFEQECIDLIKSKNNKNPQYSQINEMNRTIKIKGDYATLIQKYLYTKGL
jgi:large subunit ribosomal protein L49